MIELNTIRTLNELARETCRVDALWARTKTEESIALCRSLLQASPDSEPCLYELATALLLCSTCNFTLSDYPGSLDEAQEALRLFEALGDEKGRSGAIRNIARVYGIRGEYAEAGTLARTALDSAVLLEDEQGQADSLNILGIVYWHTGEYDKALEFYTRSLAIYRTWGEMSREVADVLSNLGLIHTTLGIYDTALEYCLESLSARETLGDQRGIASSLVNIGNIYLQKEDSGEALEFYLKALGFQQEVGDKDGMGYTLGNIASIYLELGNAEAAMGHIYTCLELARQTGDRRMEGYVFFLFGKAFEQQEKDEDALDMYNQSLEIGREIGYSSGEAIALNAAGIVLMRQQRLREACTYLHDALDMMEKMQHKVATYSIHQLLANAYEQLHEPARALSHFRQFYTIQREVFNEQSDKRLKDLQVRYQVEQTTKEAEIYRLKNVELAAANAEVYRQKASIEAQAQKIEEANELLREKNTELERLNCEKDEFLGIAAHGLKNPLSGIVMTASMVTNYIDSFSEEDIISSLARIEATARRMETLVANLLSVNAAESGELSIDPVALDLIPLLTTVVKEYEERATAKGIRLLMDNRGDAVFAFADVTMTREIADNLISNAIKFSPRYTTVTVRLSTSIRHNESAGSDYRTARIEVQDEGPGISGDDRRRLFGKFERLSAKPTGGEHSSGLGLSIVKKLTEIMGGTVEYTSEPNGGSTFIVELPVAETAIAISASHFL